MKLPPGSIKQPKKKCIILHKDSKYSFRYPFNWKNPLGYLVAVTFKYIGASYCLIFVTCSVFFGIGCCFFTLAIVSRDMKNYSMLINENAASHRNRMLTLDIIGDFVKCHSFMKRLSVFHAFQLFYINSDFSF